MNESNKKMVDAKPIKKTSQESSDSDTEIEENDAEVEQNRKEENVGLWDLAPGKEQYLELLDRANDPRESLRGVSDGSVKDNQQGGTFAWAIIKKKAQMGIHPMEYIPTGVEADMDEKHYQTRNYPQMKLTTLTEWKP